MTKTRLNLITKKSREHRQINSLLNNLDLRVDREQLFKLLMLNLPFLSTTVNLAAYYQAS